MNFIREFFDNIKFVFMEYSFFSKDTIDILLVAVLLYYIIKLARDTKATQLAKGMVLIVICYMLVLLFDLQTMRVIFQGALTLGLTTLVVVFQPELRKVLEQIGRMQMSSFDIFGAEEEYIIRARQGIDEIVEAASSMASEKTGALIVVERKTGLKDIIATGTKIDAKLSKELLMNIFFLNSPLHDGAVIVSDFNIAAAGCYLPISSDMSVSKELGTRHRAALGMSEESDAVVIVASEETGKITLAINGELNRGVSIENFRRILYKNLIPEKKENTTKKTFWRKKKNEQ